MLSTVPVVLTSLKVFDSADPSGRPLGPPFSGANPTPAAQPGGDYVVATYTNNDPNPNDPGVQVGLASSGITQATPAQISAAALLGYTLPANWSTAFPGTLPAPGTSGAPPLAVYQFYLNDHVLFDSASALVYPVGSLLGPSSVMISVNLSHYDPNMVSCAQPYQWDEIDSFYYANSSGASSPGAPNNNGGLVDNFSMSDDYGQFAGYGTANPAFYQNADHIFGGAVVDATPSGLCVSKTADSASIIAGQTAGFTVTIMNLGDAAVPGVTLTDPLPAGAGADVTWAIDTTTGNPTAFQVTGATGTQVLTLSPSTGITLAAGATLSVHVLGVTHADDASGISTNPALNVGGLAGYTVLYEGSGNNQLSIANDTIDGNIGVGGGQVQFNGPGSIGGRLDFSAANSGQYHNTNRSNVGPTSVNYSVSAVTTAINAVNSLSSSLGALSGTNITFTNTSQSINESAGKLETTGGVTYRVFNVSSYSANNADTVTIAGDGSGDPVVFNFAYNGNTNLGGQVALTGGLTNDQVIWNFTSSNKQVQLNNNGGTFQGVILAPNDQYQSDSSNLYGRVYGGAAGNMQIVSGANVFTPPSTGTLPNTATVSATGETTQTASATITITAAPQLAAGSISQAGAGLTELLDPPGSLPAGPITFAVNLPQGEQAPAVQAAIASAVSELNAEVAPLGLSLVQVSGALAGSAQVQISFASTSAIGGVSQGVIGAYTPGQITLINGWNWYFGSDASGIAPGQYDFQTVVTHELGHVLGLGENSDPSSAMDLYLSPGQVRRDLTANDLSAIQQELQTSPASLPASPAATASDAASAVAMASPSPVMAAASGTGATDLTGPAAADLEGVSAAASAIALAPRPLVVPGLEPLGDGEELQAGPLLLPASPAAAASDGAMLVAAGSSSSSVMAAAPPVLAGPAAAVPQSFSDLASSITLAGLEIAENRGMTDPLYGFGSAVPTGMPFGSFEANGLPNELGSGVQRTGLNDLIVDDHAPTAAVPAVMPVAPLTWLAAPGMSDAVPKYDAVDAVLVQDWGRLEGTPEEADEWAVSHDLNTAPVVMGVLGLAWSWKSHLGRQSANARDRRHRRTDPLRRLPARGLGLDQSGNRN